MSKTPVGSPLHTDNGLSHLLGRICIEFSAIEATLRKIVSKLLSNDSNIGAIVVSEASFPGLIGMAKSLVYYKTESAEIRAKIDGMVGELEEAQSIRNQCLHSEWTGLWERNDLVIRRKHTAKARHGLRQNWELVNAKSLTQKIELLRVVRMKLLDYDIELLNSNISNQPKIGLKLHPEVLKFIEKLKEEAADKTAPP
jgi:hypothetical protein